jgi:hypothetical protein
MFQLQVIIMIQVLPASIVHTYGNWFRAPVAVEHLTARLAAPPLRAFLRAKRAKMMSDHEHFMPRRSMKRGDRACLN